jgi:hypothetical protein
MHTPIGWSLGLYLIGTAGQQGPTRRNLAAANRGSSVGIECASLIASALIAARLLVRQVFVGSILIGALVAIISSIIYKHLNLKDRVSAHTPDERECAHARRARTTRTHDAHARRARTS